MLKFCFFFSPANLIPPQSEVGENKSIALSTVLWCARLQYCLSKTWVLHVVCIPVQYCCGLSPSRSSWGHTKPHKLRSWMLKQLDEAHSGYKSKCSVLESVANIAAGEWVSHTEGSPSLIHSKATWVCREPSFAILWSKYPEITQMEHNVLMEVVITFLWTTWPRWCKGRS